MSGDVRQQLYDRIRESSKDEVILDEMIRLGYWPRSEGQPTAPEHLIKRSADLNRQLQELYKTQGRWADPEQALKAMHKERKKAALARRQETKLKQARTRYERAQAWVARRSGEIGYLGPDVSGGLSSVAALKPLAAGLPHFENAKALADAMGVSLGELRFLCFDKPLTKFLHYRRFSLAKKTGGERFISAPMPRLKRAQYWVLDNILGKVPVHEAAHGFVTGRSIVSNAALHVNRDVVVNFDLKDFFPTVTWRRVKGKFTALGYSEALATILALLCTEPDCDEVELDGERLFARKGPRRLPQGAPTSPALTNLICLGLDKRLTGLAAKLGFTYSRYADDMTFSALGEAAQKAGTLLKAVHAIVEAEGFTVHPKKVRVMRAHRRQEVTGLVVNDRVSVPRDTLRRFRALLHNIEASGLQGKRWGKSANVLVAANGFAQFVTMVDPKVGKPLVAKVLTLSASHEETGFTRSKPGARSFRSKSSSGSQPLERWWHPAQAPAPQPEPVLAAHLAQEAAQREQERIKNNPSVLNVLGAQRQPASAHAATSGVAQPSQDETGTAPSSGNARPSFLSGVLKLFRSSK